MKSKKIIIALLTGRGNNTLKDKNILPVLGKPLLHYPATAAKRSRYIDDFFVSSDDDKILDAAAEVGYRKIKRPDEYARPDSLHIDAILHALAEMKAASLHPDILVVLLANSVTVKTDWIDGCIDEILNDDNISSVVPVNLIQDYHPYRAKKLNADGFLEPYFDFSKEKVSTNRQDLPHNYFLCHNFWVLNVGRSLFSENGQPPWTFMGDRIKPYVVDETFDVHDRNDLELSERWLRENPD